jgi:hypothetical protein
VSAPASTPWSNLCRGLSVRLTVGSSGSTISPHPSAAAFPIAPRRRRRIETAGRGGRPRARARENAQSGLTRPSRIGGALLIALAAYVVIVAGWNLWTRHTDEFSLPGFIVTLLAIPVMRYLARRKIELANQLASRALRADAMESVTCGWLSVVAVVSLGAQAVSGIWWIDSVGSLAIVWLLVKEGREAWRGECCADC